MYFTTNIIHADFKQRFILRGVLLPFLVYSFTACPSTRGIITLILVRNINPPCNQSVSYVHKIESISDRNSCPARNFSSTAITKSLESGLILLLLSLYVMLSTASATKKVMLNFNCKILLTHNGIKNMIEVKGIDLSCF